MTWHLMTGGIDEGEVLVTRSFEIAVDDTAFSLNARCFSAALDSFAEVMSALKAGGHPRRPQDAGPRKIWRRADRPPAAGRLDFGTAAATVVRTVRALDHGGYRNPLAVPKIEVHGQVWAVGRAEVVPGAGAPGAVLSAEPDALVIACADGAVRLSALTCLKGLPVDLTQIGAGPLPSPSSDRAAELDKTMAVVAQAEPLLRGLLLKPDPLLVGAEPSAAPAWQSITLGAPGASAATRALSALRSFGRTCGDIAWSSGFDPAPGYVLPWVPLRLDAGGSTTAATARTARAIDTAREAIGVAADLALREPGLTTFAPPGLALTEGAAPITGTAVTISTSGAPNLWFDANRITPADATRLASRMTRIADAMAASPEGDLADISPLSHAEEQVYSGALTATAREYDRQISLPAAILAQAKRSPDAIAVIAGETRMTYADLARRAAQIAHVLREMGVGRGMVVGLACRRTADMVAGAIGIQMAGAAYVPMDPGYPADRLSLYAEDSGCPVILTESTVVDALPKGPTYLVLDTDSRLASALNEPPTGGPSGDDPAYVIYTSGSTGRPKGVVVGHRNVMNFFAGMDDVLGTDPGTWLAVTSLSFDISVLELFWTLSRGFTVGLADDAARVRPEFVVAVRG